MKSVFSGSSSRVRTMYTRCSEREACPFARAFARELATHSTRDLRLPRLFYFLCLSVNLLSLHRDAPRYNYARYCRAPWNDYEMTTEFLPLFSENANLRIATIREAKPLIRLTYVLYLACPDDQKSRDYDLF